MNLLLPQKSLVGIGLYTPAEAARLSDVPASRLVRWLKGHRIGARFYEPLWRPQVDLGDGSTHLGFRDLLQVKMADAFIGWGLPPQRVRLVIERAREWLGDEHPLATNRFKTDGRTIFMEVVEDSGDARLIDLARNQWTMRDIVAPFMKQVDFGDGGVPLRWWPAGRSGGVFLDPSHSFGQPIEADSHVPAAILAAASLAEGSVEAAARAWGVKVSSVRRAVAFEQILDQPSAA
ncbi:hypothetical protein EDC65_1953 [Stella humosa]|uniref:DUF433 domain-containing protein n=1 Tax=Stella humosa TaxID=94 RepID=A0A3N1MBS8_9PROT|nr:hypothetical protein [Stella humosa]ROQ00157.1 hypothetical protein EDC65_1953 [Stella humosa]BBK30609.1 hypothetical protein STHU_12430 [Stella humosa]